MTKMFIFQQDTRIHSSNLKRNLTELTLKLKYYAESKGPPNYQINTESSFSRYKFFVQLQIFRTHYLIGIVDTAVQQVIVPVYELDDDTYTSRSLGHNYRSRKTHCPSTKEMGWMMKLASLAIRIGPVLQIALTCGLVWRYGKGWFT